MAKHILFVDHVQVSTSVIFASFTIATLLQWPEIFCINLIA